LSNRTERFGPTRRGGPVFRWLGRQLAIDLANTVMVVRQGEAVDLLDGPEDLRHWLLAEKSRLGDCEFALSHLEVIRALREAVRDLLVARAEGASIPEAALRRVNAASKSAPVAPQLRAVPDGEPRLIELPAGKDRLARLLGTLARSAIALLSGPESERLHICPAPSCGMIYVGSRRWCSGPCGNRGRVARHYQRTRE